MIGTEKFWEYYQAFGLSEKTGIDLPGESEDLFFSEDGSMGPMDLAVAAFGQNFSITPIQMITAVSAVANGGNLVQPHVVKQIIDYDGNVVETVETKIKRQVVSPEVSEILNGILEENTISGGAQNGYVSGYRVTGKTGTSEKKIDVDGDGVDDYIASFCGYAPADNPQIAVLVFFDAPTAGSYYGSQVAAPVFAKIMNEVLPYMEVETQYTDEEMKNLDTVAESYIGYSVEDAEKAIKDAELNVLIQGDGDTVISQIPKSGSAIPKNGTVVLYTDEESTKQQVAVPDFTGLGIYDVNYLASLNNLNVSFSGTFTADGCTCASQEIQEGSMVSPGTVIKVSFVTSGIND